MHAHSTMKGLCKNEQIPPGQHHKYYINNTTSINQTCGNDRPTQVRRNVIKYARIKRDNYATKLQMIIILFSAETYSYNNWYKNAWTWPANMNLGGDNLASRGLSVTGNLLGRPSQIKAIRQLQTQ